MTKSHRVALVLITVVAVGFAGFSGFLYAKVISLKNDLNDARNTKQLTDQSASTKAATTTTTPTKTTETPATTVTTPAPLNNRPSSPSDTVTVAQGDTLSSIGQTVGVSWTVLAEINGVDADKIKIGQALVVPKNNQVAYTVNAEKAASLQKTTDAGSSAFRLSPVETAKSDAPTIYGLIATDPYSQTQIDLTSGTAQVMATHAGKNYIISLTQPVTKGAKGIWAITSIKASA